MKNTLLIAALAVCAGGHAASWTWTFDDNLNELGGGPALTATGVTSFVDATINGEAARAMRLDASFLTGGSWLSLNNPIGANGGGTRTNTFSILMDVKIPGASAGTFHSLLQTDPVPNANDGDWFINGVEGLGISGNYTDTGNSLRFTPNVWTRIVLTIDNTNTATGDGRAYRSYVNGQLQNIVQNAALAIDGRFTLQNVLHFFADEDLESRWPMEVNNIMLFDSYLSASEVELWAGAQAGAPTPIPEPFTMGVLALGAAVVARRRSKKS